jgi:predicted nucleic acid-binding protein
MTGYSIDTNILIESWRKHYRPKSFPAFWDRMSEGIADGHIRASDEVRVEIDKYEDELFDWCKDQTGLFLPLEIDIQLAVKDALVHCARMVGSHKGHNAADPWVIATAKARDMTVVTLEALTGNTAKPRVPDVCQILGVPCIDLYDFIEELGWSF